MLWDAGMPMWFGPRGISMNFRVWLVWIGPLSLTRPHARPGVRCLHLSPTTLLVWSRGLFDLPVFGLSVKVDIAVMSVKVKVQCISF